MPKHHPTPSVFDFGPSKKIYDLQPQGTSTFSPPLNLYDFVTMPYSKTDELAVNTIRTLAVRCSPLPLPVPLPHHVATPLRHPILFPTRYIEIQICRDVKRLNC